MPYTVCRTIAHALPKPPIPTAPPTERTIIIHTLRTRWPRIANTPTAGVVCRPCAIVRGLCVVVDTTEYQRLQGVEGLYRERWLLQLQRLLRVLKLRRV